MINIINLAIIIFLRKGRGVKINHCGTSDIISVPNRKTKDENGKMIIGDTTKTDNSFRTIKMNNISRSIVEQALKHKITKEKL